MFENEPLLEVEAPIAEAQLLESLLMNLVQLETVLASKAVRLVIAARGRPVVDFGLRRMHGIDAAVRGVRAYRTAGLEGTSNVLGGLRHGMALRGTMAHSYILAHDDEREAFRAFARRYPGTTLLVDTHDTLEGVRKVIEIMREEPEVGVMAIRLDSGDLGELAEGARERVREALAALPAPPARARHGRVGLPGDAEPGTRGAAPPAVRATGICKNPACRNPRTPRGSTPLPSPSENDMPLRRLLIALLTCLPLAAAAAEAPAAPSPSYRKAEPAAETAARVAPQPFAARYRLEVSGWPSTSVHRTPPSACGWPGPS